MTLDLSWRSSASSNREREIFDAVVEAGTQEAAAIKLGINRSNVTRALQRIELRAAREGHAPGHFDSGTAPGYLMGKVTVQRAKDGTVERTWERQSPDAARETEMMRIVAEALAEDISRAEPVAAPIGGYANNLCNVYTLTDSHVGQLSWGKETGEPWDLKIAEATLTRCFAQMVLSSPRARVAFVNQLGDFMHRDGLMPVTPTSGHILDADGRFSKMVAVAIRVLRRVIDMALNHHETVVVLIAEGNHDMAGSVWLRHMLAALYEKEPRVQVIDSELPYYAYQHGDTMLAFHHGHLKKTDQLPLLFAAQFPKIWGSSTRRYAHTGHRHHTEEREHSGMTVFQHPTLAARDAYAARGGWVADRRVTSVSYHTQFGEVARNSVTPEMVM